MKQNDIDLLETNEGQDARSQGKGYEGMSKKYKKELDAVLTEMSQLYDYDQLQMDADPLTFFRMVIEELTEARIAKKKKAEAQDSYVRKCIISGRGSATPGDLFPSKGGDTLACLDGYAVIPIEEYITSSRGWAFGLAENQAISMIKDGKSKLEVGE